MGSKRSKRVDADIDSEPFRGGNKGEASGDTETEMPSSPATNDKRSVPVTPANATTTRNQVTPTSETAVSPVLFRPTSQLPAPGDYTPAPMYDQQFSKYCRPIRLEHIQKSENDDSWSDSDDVVQDPHTKFLFVLLLNIQKPKTDKSILSYTSHKNNSKRGKASANYKVKYTFASLHDENGKTCVLLETTNDNHNLFFHHNKAHIGISVGERFAMQSPRAVGFLNTGSIIIETYQPFIHLTGPSMRPVALNTSTVEHELRYFALKGNRIKYCMDQLPVVWKTSCNSNVCDRLTFGGNTTQVCGCFGQNSKNDSSARNCILKFDLKFRDSHKKVVEVPNFTSLRTTKMFFKNLNVVGDYNSLSLMVNHRLLQKKFMLAVNYVNKNGGWTIVGWHIRGELEDDTKEEADNNKLSEKLKTNISYLYPTKLDPKKLPDDAVFLPSDLHLENASPQDQANQSQGEAADIL